MICLISSFRSTSLGSFSLASSSSVPAMRDYSDTGWETDIRNEMFISRFFAVSWDFFETYKLNIVAGRAFSEDQSTDRNYKVIINETAANMIGFSNPEDAIGKKWHSDRLTLARDSLLEGQIIGVVKDFYFQSLKNKLGPLTLILNEKWMNNISVKFEDGKDQAALTYTEKVWNEHFPDIQYSYSFINDYLIKYYKADHKLQIILLIFTVLTIIITCFGLFGLALFNTRQRVKEIGIRKVFGSSNGNIILLLCKSFSKYILLASIIAWPVAWYFINEWLSTFQYATRLNLWIFFISSVLILTIALMTIIYQSYRVAISNPVDSLRNE